MKPIAAYPLSPPPLTCIVVVHGPPASGKTLNRDALAKWLACDAVIDGVPLPRREESIQARGRVLILTTDEEWKASKLKYRTQVSLSSLPVAAAAAALGSRWIKPNPAFQA